MFAYVLRVHTASKDLDPAVFGLILLVVGIIAICFGLLLFLRRQKIMNTPTSKVAAVAMGAVEVYGKAKPITSLKSPLKKADCAYYKTDVYRFEKRGKHSSWALIKSFTEGEEFIVEDETGSIMVDASSWRLLFLNTAPANVTPQIRDGFFDISADYTFETGGQKLEDLPQEVRDFFEDSRISYEKEKFFGLPSQMFFHYENIRIIEKYIAPGDMVYVFGYAQPLDLEGNRPAPAGATVKDEFIGFKKGEMFYISDRSEKKVTGTLLWQAPLLTAVGAIVTCIGVALLIIIKG